MATRHRHESIRAGAQENASGSEHAQRAVEQVNAPPYTPVPALRERAWELHLRGMPKARIARELGLDRGTVSRYIQACYAEVNSDGKASARRRLAGAIARMRRIQEQAWSDHDADDERERAVLGAVLGAVLSGEAEGHGEQPKSRSMVRYQSQRSQYLRLALDAEKEIARLEGLYEASGDESGAVVFRIERLAAGVVAVSAGAGRAERPDGSDGGSDGDSDD